MRGRLYIHKSLILIIYLLISSCLYGGSNGKIAGIITNVKTGKPLIGVNVIVKGTSFGAATDKNGQFVILDLRPEEYTLTASYIGYQTVNVKNMLVKTDRTTNIDVKIKPASVHMQSKEINYQPISGVGDILKMSPGVNRNADGTISIRGGGGDDINYSINGIMIMNTNTSVTAFGGSGMSKSRYCKKFMKDGSKCI